VTEDDRIISREVLKQAAPLTAADENEKRQGFMEALIESVLSTEVAQTLSIGNLILAAGYLNNRKHLDPVIYIFSRLVQVRGLVRPIANTYLHLVTELENGRTLIGQHLLTGKETEPIKSRVRRVYLSSRKRSPRPVDIAIRPKTRKLIESADLICFPIGSFYSSVVANLLPRGVGKAIAAAGCPKVFIPNTFDDPEQYGMSLEDQVTCLIEYLRLDDSHALRPEDVMNFILLDQRNGDYPGIISKRFASRNRIQQIDTRLISDQSRPKVDPLLLIKHLLSLA